MIVTYECQNCGELWTDDELVKDIADYSERVADGEPEPAGECPVVRGAVS